MDMVGNATTLVLLEFSKAVRSIDQHFRFISLSINDQLHIQVGLMPYTNVYTHTAFTVEK